MKSPAETPMSRHVANSRIQWLALLLVVVAGGCVGAKEDLTMDDRVVFSSLRVTHDLFQSAKAEENTNASRVAVELDLHHASGTDSQDLGASELIDFGGIEFSGPAQLDGDYDLLAGSLAVRVGLSDPTDRAGIAFLLGLSVQDFDLRVNAGTLSAQDDRRSIGPMFGLEGSVRASSWLGLYGRFTQAIGFSDATTTLGFFEAGVSVRPVSHVVLATGLRWERYTQPRLLSQLTGVDETRIDLKLHGPVVGLQVDF